jgi:HK97 family phage major capsid protein
VGEFATAVAQAYTPGGQLDERLRVGAAPTNFHYEVGSNEGAMVPPSFREEVWNAVEEYSAIWNDLQPEPTSSNAVDFLRDETTPWGSTGVQARWRAEDAQMTASKLVTSPSTMRLHELYAFVSATNDLLSDAPRLNNRLTLKAGQAIAYSIDNAAANGTGVGQPLGWSKSGALVTVAKESAQVAATFVAANAAKMYSRLLNPGQGIWYVNQSVLSQLFTMTIGDQPMWYGPNATLRDTPDGGMLFGRPVKTFQGCETLGTVGDVYFVNPMGYYAIQRQNQPEFAQSIHLYFDYNMTAFRWTVRVGGQPFLSAPVSPAKGSDTLSHFVTLATRN